MTLFILVVMIFPGENPILKMQEFTSEATCKAAGELIWQTFTKAHVDSDEIFLSCLAK